MTVARTLAEAMPEFTRQSPRGGTIRVDDDVVPVEVDRAGERFSLEFVISLAP